VGDWGRDDDTFGLDYELVEDSFLRRVTPSERSLDKTPIACGWVNSFAFCYQVGASQATLKHEIDMSCVVTHNHREFGSIKEPRRLIFISKLAYMAQYGILKAVSWVLSTFRNSAEIRSCSSADGVMVMVLRYPKLPIPFLPQFAYFIVPAVRHPVVDRQIAHHLADLFRYWPHYHISPLC
jgi:hypothetical protein